MYMCIKYTHIHNSIYRYLYAERNIMKVTQLQFIVKKLLLV